jgi:hypothetical protein
MTDLRTAAQQALEALESTQLFAAHEHYPRRRVADALDALSAALEQPEQEPVAWRHLSGHIQGRNPNWSSDVATGYTREKGWIPLYTYPPRREWRGLTEEDERAFLDSVVGSLPVAKNLIRAIEAALKEKNSENL